MDDLPNALSQFYPSIGMPGSGGATTPLGPSENASLFPVTRTNENQELPAPTQGQGRTQRDYIIELKDDRFLSWSYRNALIKEEEIIQTMTQLLQERGVHIRTGKATWDETYSDPILVPTGPVTSARAKKFKDALMGLIRATWSQAIAWRPIEGITSNDQPIKCVIQVLEETE